MLSRLSLKLLSKLDHLAILSSFDIPFSLFLFLGGDNPSCTITGSTVATLPGSEQSRSLQEDSTVCCRYIEAAVLSSSKANFTKELDKKTQFLHFLGSFFTLLGLF